MNSSVDLALVALRRVVEVEALALGEDAVADLEDLRVGVDAVDGDADQVGGADPLAGDPLALHQRTHGVQPVAVGAGALELLRGRGLVHLRLEVAPRPPGSDRRGSR